MPQPVLKKYLTGVSSLLFPVICKGCGETLTAKQTVLCRHCESTLPRTHFESDPQNPVVQMFWGRARLHFATSVFFYRKGELLQALIHQLKYKNNKEAGTLLGTLAAKAIKRSPAFSDVDALVPVPLHPRKERIRGYNQSLVLANGLSSIAHYPVSHQTVVRTHYSESQTTRGRYDRWKNVEGIFKVLYPDRLVNKHILIVDDVVTTGSTIEALCNALQTVGKIKISVLTIGFAAG